MRSLSHMGPQVKSQELSWDITFLVISLLGGGGLQVEIRGIDFNQYGALI